MSNGRGLAEAIALANLAAKALLERRHDLERQRRRAGVAELDRADAELFGVGMIWVGAGNACPSEVQLELINTLKPTVFMGMSSFVLHLANLAEAKGLTFELSMPAQEWKHP